MAPTFHQPALICLGLISRVRLDMLRSVDPKRSNNPTTVCRSGACNCPLALCRRAVPTTPRLPAVGLVPLGPTRPKVALHRGLMAKDVAGCGSAGPFVAQDRNERTVHTTL